MVAITLMSKRSGERQPGRARLSSPKASLHTKSLLESSLMLQNRVLQRVVIYSLGSEEAEVVNEPGEG